MAWSAEKLENFSSNGSVKRDISVCSGRRLGSAAGLAIAVLFPMANSAEAQNTWTGEISSDWAAHENWSGSIPSGENVTIDLATGAGDPFPVLEGTGQSGLLRVGGAELGELVIRNGGQLTSDAGLNRIADAEGSIGNVTVTGTNSSWTNTGNLQVGRGGAGTLNVENGGFATNGIGFIGVQQTATGIVNVTGAGSEWNNTSGLSIGGAGSGTLSISDGGLVSSAGSAAVGNVVNAGEGIVLVSGEDSRWTHDGDLQIGLFGQGEMTVTSGGSVSNAEGSIGAQTGSTGLVTIRGADTTWINSGGLTIGQSGSGTLAIEEGGVVSNATATIGSQLDRTGKVQVTGAGSEWNSSGALTIGFRGNGELSISDGGHVSASSVFLGRLSDGEGTLNIGAAAGEEAISAGTLETGSVNFSNGTGTINFNHTSPQYLFSSNVSGNGEVNILSGTTIFAGNNTYTGLTTIAAGTLQIGNGGALGSLGRGDVLMSGGTLAFDRSSSYTYGGEITGSGTLRQVGTGRTILTGNSGSFGGSTEIMSGELAVNGVLGGTVNIANGGLLMGSGSVGETRVNSGGIIAPGNSIDTLSVDGDLTFEPGSIYRVEVDPTGTRSDLIAVNGTAYLAGSVLHIGEDGDYKPYSEYKILTATGGFDGTTFDEVRSDYTFLESLLSYSTNDVTLRLARNDVSFSSVAATPNQRATAGGLDSLPIGNAINSAIVMLDEPAARKGFDMLSGEPHASAITSMIGNSGTIRSVVLSRFRSRFGSGRPLAASLVTTRANNGSALGLTSDEEKVTDLNVWGHVFGSQSRFDGDGNTARLRYSQSGFLIGADTNLNDVWGFGVFAGYSPSTFSVRDRNSSGSSDNFHLGFYGGAAIDSMRLNVGAAYTWHNIDTLRTVAFPGFSDSLSASYRSHTAQVFGEAGYMFDIDTLSAGTLSLEPFAGLAYVHNKTNSFSENGGPAALTALRSTTATSFSTLGLRALSQIDMGSMRATVHGMVGWRRAIGDTTPTMNFSFAGSDVFDVSGTSLAKDTALIEAGLNLEVRENVDFGLSYGGRYSSHGQEHRFNAQLQVSF